MNLSNVEVCDKVNAMFVDLFELESDKLIPAAHLYTDLSLDSLDAIDLVISFERVFKIKPPHEEIRNIQTLGDVHQLVLKYYSDENQAN